LRSTVGHYSTLLAAFVLVVTVAWLIALVLAAKLRLGVAF
jgi:hypothetical protein